MTSTLNLETTTVVVTGAAGFIASALITKILENTTTTQVIGIDSLDPYYSIEIKKQRLRQLSKNHRFHFKKFSFASMQMKQLLDAIDGPIVFIHAAAKVGLRAGENNPQSYLKTNVLAVETLLSYLQTNQAIKHSIFFSSSSVYGDSPNLPFNEASALDVLAARSLYGVSKVSLELLVRRFHLLSSIPITVVRPFNVYGPKGRPDMLPLKIITTAQAGETLEVFGTNTTNKRDWTYIDDCTELLWQIVIQPHHYEIVNIGSGVSLGIGEVIEIATAVLRAHYGIALQTKAKPVIPFDGRITLADVSKAQKLYNYQPRFSFKEGFALTCAEYFGNYIQSS